MVNYAGIGSGLDLAVFRERMHMASGHDEMVEDAHLHEGQGLRQRARQQ